MSRRRGISNAVFVDVMFHARALTVLLNFTGLRSPLRYRWHGRGLMECTEDKVEAEMPVPCLPVVYAPFSFLDRPLAGLAGY